MTLDSDRPRKGPRHYNGTSCNLVHNWYEIADTIRHEDGTPYSRQAVIDMHDKLVRKLRLAFMRDPIIREYLLENGIADDDGLWDTDDIRHRDDRD